MLNRAAALIVAAAVVAGTACGSSTTPGPSKIVAFSANLTPGGEPAVTGNPTGSGTFTATLDTSTNAFTYNVTFTGLTTNAILGHIHGPFPNGTATSAGVMLNFDPAVTPGVSFVGLKTATSGTASGTVTLNAGTQFTGARGDSLRKLLLAGLTYVNIHTSTNPAGEIRGQIAIKQ